MQAVWHDYCMPWLPRAPVHYQTTSVLLNKAGEDHLLAQGAQLSSIQLNLLPHIRIRQPCSSWQLGTASDLCYPLNHAWTFTVMALNWPESKKKVLMSKLASKHYGWSRTALSPVLCLCLVGFYRNSFRYFSCRYRNRCAQALPCSPAHSHPPDSALGFSQLQSSSCAPRWVWTPNHHFFLTSGLRSYF